MPSRIDGLRRALAERGLGGFLVSNLSNCRYLSGFVGDSGWLLLTDARCGVAVDSRFWEAARRQAPDFELLPIRGDLPDWFLKTAAEWGVNRWGIEAEAVSLAAYQKLTAAIARDQSPVQLVPTIGLIETQRSIKDPAEIELLEKASQLAARALDHARSAASPGMTERELAWELERFLRENGSEAMGFEIIAASGPNCALPHARPSERRIEAGEPVLLDLGARLEGYCSDFTRTFCVGKPSPLLVKVHSIVLGAQLTALTTIQSGMTGEQADQLARTVINQAGYEQAFGHGLGHGVGLDVHERPRVGARSQDVLVDGMVFTIEPGVYLPGWGGVRIEDTVVMEGGRARPLAEADKSLEAR